MKISKSLRIFLAVLLPLVMIGSIIFLYFHNPDTTVLPFCVIRKFTGLDCPGCGMTHALYALLHFQFAKAFRFNPFVFPLVVCLSAIAVIFYRALVTGKYPHLKFRLSFPVVLAILMAIAVFTVLRNIPFWPFCYFKV